MLGRLRRQDISRLVKWGFMRQVIPGWLAGVLAAASADVGFALAYDAVAAVATFFAAAAASAACAIAVSRMDADRPSWLARHVMRWSRSVVRGSAMIFGGVSAGAVAGLIVGPHPSGSHSGGPSADGAIRLAIVVGAGLGIIVAVRARRYWRGQRLRGASTPTMQRPHETSSLNPPGSAPGGE